MEYTKLGNTDIEVSKVCVGCMSFGKAGTMHDWTLDESDTEDMVKHALGLGIDFLILLMVIRRVQYNEKNSTDSRKNST